MQFNYFTLIFLIATFAYVLTLLWLNSRQKKAIIKSFDAVPIEFNKSITLTDHQKSAKYTQAKLSISCLEIIFTTVVLLLWTIGEGLNYLDVFWQSQSNNILYVGIGFIISLMLIGNLIDLPFKFYRTFVLEQKFGFNKTTTTTFISDFIKSVVLTLIIGLPLIYAILYLMEIRNEYQYWWLYVWLLLISFSLLTLWLYPTYIAPIFNKFKPLKDVELVTKINNLLKRTGFKSDGLFIMDGSKRSTHGNAYFTGIGKNKRIVFFDTLLKNMENQEIEAILAHELGHFHHKHIRKQMLVSFSILLLGLAFLSYLIDQPWFFHGLGVDQMSNYTALILFILILPVFVFFISPINNILSRKHEFEADAFAAKHTSATHLISSLVKLYRDNASTLTPDELYSAFHDSHPNATIRINHLKTYEKTNF